MANFLLPLGLGVLGFMGQQSAAKAQTAGAEAATIGAQSQKELADYMLGRKRNYYDPLEEKYVTPNLVRRVTEGPAWAPQAGFWAKSLASKMAFPTEDVEGKPRGM